MRLIETIFVSVLIILVFQSVSSAQPGTDKPQSSSKQVQVEVDSAPNKATADSKQAPEIEILSIRYENSITVPIDFSEGIPLNGLGLDTEKEVAAPNGYTFLEVTFKLNNMEIDNLEIDDIEITDPEGNKDIPTIFIDATWNVSIQSFITRSSYHSSSKETIPCTFVIADKFREKELMLEIAKYNLKHVIPKPFEFKKSENVLTLTPGGNTDASTLFNK